MAATNKATYQSHRRLGKPEEGVGKMTDGSLPDIWEEVREDNLDKVQDILVAHPEMLNKQEPHTLLTPLHVAAALGNRRISLFLLEQDEIDGWIRDQHGRPPLALAYTTKDKSFIDMFARHVLPKHMKKPAFSVVPTPE